MQRPDEEKRKTILRVARDLFSRRPYHEVRLDDVAAAAKVGKGTLYVYFPSKDELYVALVAHAFDELLAEIQKQITASAAAKDSAWETLEDVVGRVAKWTLKHPTIFDLMRSGVHPSGAESFRTRRRKLGELIEQVIIRGVEAGEMDDPTPELTAQFIPAMARSAALYARGNTKHDELAARILGVLGNGIRRRRRA